jgi:hypothetical protein
MIFRIFLAAAFCVAILAGALFTPGLPGEFVFDDIPNIVNNQSVHIDTLDAVTVVEVLSAPQVSGTMRSLPTLTFALDYWRGGGADPAVFRATNILIHALTTLLLAFFFRRLLGAAGFGSLEAGWFALSLTLAWAVHPLHVSAVLYVVQRLQTMGTLFLVLALLGYVIARQAQVAGGSGRQGFIACGVSWAFALGCKEDSVLLPIYTLALELTVFRFAAANVRIAAGLRYAYGSAVLLGILVYLCWVIPAYWQSDPYPGREFNSLERLLTQGRVLCMYLGQALWPLPHHMPFFYDWLQPSRGITEPWFTLPAIGLVCGLLVLAWHQRKHRPLLALGIFWFFSAHLITSNVVGLELAFEHRNHFALIGVVLAVGSIMKCALSRIPGRPGLVAMLIALPLLAMSVATWQRANSWRDNVSLASAATRAAPTSPRAWIELCTAELKAGGGVVRDNPRLDAAIEACSAGADAAMESLNNLSVLVALKALRGDLSGDDWIKFHQRLEAVPLSWDNIRAPLVLTHYAGLGVPIDKDEILEALATLDRRAALGPQTLVSIGDAVAIALQDPDRAMPYYMKALPSVPPEDPIIVQLSHEMRERGRPDLAEQIEAARRISAPEMEVGADSLLR